jgi:hypothetical protein
LFALGLTIGGGRIDATGSLGTWHDPDTQPHSLGIVNDQGIVNDRIEAHPLNAFSPIWVSFDPTETRGACTH